MSEIIDFKKKNRELYSPKTEPSKINVPEMFFVAVQGKGNPNEPDGEYQTAIPVLYGILYTIKMSKKADFTPKGYFDYVVPPLEGLWWLSDNIASLKDKSKYNWISMIRLPEFVDENVLQWACRDLAKKKKIDTSKAFLYKYNEGLSVQCMHIGIYDEEPKTLAKMEEYIQHNNLISDLTETRRHHEIYLSDPRKTATDKMKTVLRVPVKVC